MATHVSTGSSGSVVACHAAAVDGDTITVPAGRFVWSSNVTFTKAVLLLGGGAGRVLARSASSVAVATGTKNFSLITEGVASIAALRAGITTGATLKIYRTGGDQNGTFQGTGLLPWLRGTVTSLVGDTLTMNITSVSTEVTGVHPLWIITTEAVTEISHGGPSDSRMLSITEGTTHRAEISGIRFSYDASGGRNEVQQLLIASVSGGKPALVHDCYFERTLVGTLVKTRRGIFWSCSFVSPLMALSGLAIQNVDLTYSTSWTTAGTMGTADTDGSTNLYVEDCDFHAWISATDCDSNSRAVFRKCLVNHGSLASHGADTGPFGVRHVEIYDCRFAYQPYGDGQTLPLDRMINMRGGVWVVTDNVFDLFSSTDYGDKTEITVEVQNLGKSAGPNPGWGYNISGIQYPCPRQVGMGRITGAAGNDPTGVYIGDPDPCYIWNNTGTVVIGLANYGWGYPDIMPNSGQADFESKVDLISGYVQFGRDIFQNAGAKPGWTKPSGAHPAAYPHSARTFAWPAPRGASLRYPKGHPHFA